MLQPPPQRLPAHGCLRGQPAVQPARDDCEPHEAFNHDCKEATKYSNYDVAKPFTSLRAMAVEILVLMVESEETVASSLLTPDTWKLFISWVVTYAHNNVFHALFYRIVFAVLRFVV